MTTGIIPRGLSLGDGPHFFDVHRLQTMGSGGQLCRMIFLSSVGVEGLSLSLVYLVISVVIWRGI